MSSAALLFLIMLVATPHAAGAEPLPASLFSETAGGASAPNEFTAADFTVEWKGPALEGVTATIAERSLEWMRVETVLVLPRGRLVLTARGVRSGSVTSAGFTTPFDGTVEVPVALLSGESNPIEVRLDEQRKGTLVVRFRPRATISKRRVSIDHSCSPFGVRVVDQTWDNTNQWVSVGCRLQHLAGVGGRTTALELLVHWDNVGASAVSVGGARVEPATGSLWRLRLTPTANRVSLMSGSQSLALSYSIPAVDHAAWIGLGVGPYVYAFEAPRTNTHSVVGLATLYGALRLSDQNRLVFFDASAASSAFYNDTGVYFSTETSRALDRRLSVNIMLGAHVLIFNAGGDTFVRPGGPQGFELAYRDAFKRAHTLSAGAFIYPPIDSRSYYNVWLRWGSSSFFGELNFIAWREKVGQYESQGAYNRSLGITVGMPLLRFY